MPVELQISLFIMAVLIVWDRIEYGKWWID